MQAIWYQDEGTKASIRGRLVSGAGKATSPVLTVVSGWGSLIEDPKIINTGGGKRMVVFAGLHSSSSSDKLNGPLVATTSSNGKSWTLQNGSLSQTANAYASYGTSALSDGGVPFVGVFASSTSYMTVHRGLSPSRPAASGDWTTKQGLGCCAYNGDLGRDAKTGDIWAVWYSNSSTKSQNGILAQRVYPKPIGKLLQAPGSSVKGSSLDPGVTQAVAVASRQGGQVWAAYKVGYPTANKIRLWQVGTRKGFLVRSPDVRRITLEPGLNGRLWLVWQGGSSRSIKVTRTNTRVTRIGRVQTFKAPTHKGQYSSVYSLSGTGLGGALHLLVNAQIGTADPQIWYRRVPPGLTVTATPAKLSAGKVKVKVTDAGAPVSGARVSFLGGHKTTKGSGTVVFRVRSSTPSGKVRATATKAGYAKGADVVRIT
jgi:hypothetical protein